MPGSGSNADALRSISANIVTAQGLDISPCVYCDAIEEEEDEVIDMRMSYAFGLTALHLTCETYQAMMEKGWRRAGTYCYEPDARRSCCAQYPIKLDALAYYPSKCQRKTLTRWTRFVVGTDALIENTKDQRKGFQWKSPARHAFNLTAAIHAPEYQLYGTSKARNKFEVALELPSHTAEKYDLYDKYQTQVHHDSHNLPYIFYRLLVESPLRRKSIPYPGSRRPPHLPAEYGSYHQTYRLNGQLIALSVIDIVPSGISSVYFAYDRRWGKFSLGKLSAMREAALVREIHDAGIPSMTSLLLGFYVHNNHKMVYKCQFSPSYLADPEEKAWFPLEVCIPLLDRYKYACFAHPEYSRREPQLTMEDPANVRPQDDDSIPYLNRVRFAHAGAEGIEVLPITDPTGWTDGQPVRPSILSTIRALGPELAPQIVFH